MNIQSHDMARSIFSPFIIVTCLKGNIKKVTKNSNFAHELLECNLAFSPRVFVYKHHQKHSYGTFRKIVSVLLPLHVLKTV